MTVAPTPALSNVTPLVGRRNNLADVPFMLRKLADDLEADAAKLAALIGAEEVQVRVISVVRISGSEPSVHAFGKMDGVAQAFMDLHAGAQQLMMMSHPER